MPPYYYGKQEVLTVPRNVKYKDILEETLKVDARVAYSSMPL
jgi:hypothetical protein